MRRRTAVPTILAAGALLLALPGVAGAGGFATVGLSSLPDGTAPGRPWHVTLTILQHGRTPMSDLRPTVRVASADGLTVRTFAARRAGRPGTYTVSVVFPAAGRWTYSIDDGFTQTHTYAPVAIGASAAVPAVPPAAASGGRGGTAAPAGGDDGGGGNVVAAFGAALAGGLLAALATALVLRRREPGAAPDTAAATR
jgi:hypothetical protein